jgi:hypothetical protein
LAELIFVVVGLLMQLVGAYVTYRGFRIGWEETASPSDKFLAPVIHWIDRRGEQVTAFFRRLFPQRAHSQTIHASSIAETWAVGDDFRVSKSFAPLPEHAGDAELIAELDRRLRHVYEEVNRVENKLLDDTRERKAESARLEGELRGSLATKEDRDRDRSIRGLRIEALGFGLLTLGALVQGVGSVVGIDLEPVQSQPSPPPAVGSLSPYNPANSGGRSI